MAATHKRATGGKLAASLLIAACSYMNMIGIISLPRLSKRQWLAELMLTLKTRLAPFHNPLFSQKKITHFLRRSDWPSAHRPRSTTTCSPMSDCGNSKTADVFSRLCSVLVSLGPCFAPLTREEMRRPFERHFPFSGHLSLSALIPAFHPSRAFFL